MTAAFSQTNLMMQMGTHTWVIGRAHSDSFTRVILLNIKATTSLIAI